MRLSILMLVCAYAQAGVVDGVATISKVEGSGEIVSSTSKPLLKGVTFQQDVRVKTAEKSSAIVLLSNGTKVVVNQDAVVYFKVMKQEDGSLLAPSPDDKSQKETGASLTEIEVESGKVIGDVKKLVPNSVFTLKTPVGVVSIKGTVFSVEFKRDKDGNSVFNVGCLVGRVSVQMADPNVAPVSVPAGKQLSMSAPPPPPPTAQKEGEQKGEKGGEKPAPPPPMKMEIAELPPAEMKAMVMATPDRPPPPPNAPPTPPQRADALDKIIQNVEEAVRKDQLNPTPTGG